jgi:hypothetical protein
MRYGIVALLLAGCGAPANEPDPVTGGTTEIVVGTSTGDTADSTGNDPGSTSDPGTGDEPYPRPEPVTAEGSCPVGSFGPITFDGEAWICIPECMDAEPQCPAPSSGTAEAVCATNPFSSSDPCMDDADCTIEGEACGNIGSNQRGCLLAPSHCILRCDAESVCPTDMICTSARVCAYTP